LILLFFLIKYIQYEYQFIAVTSQYIVTCLCVVSTESLCENDVCFEVCLFIVKGYFQCVSYLHMSSLESEYGLNVIKT
jgi:hypothetical protein